MIRAAGLWLFPLRALHAQPGTVAVGSDTLRRVAKATRSEMLGLAAGDDVMAAFLNIWLRQTPVSDDIKSELLEGLAGRYG